MSLSYAYVRFSAIMRSRILPITYRYLSFEEDHGPFFFSRPSVSKSLRTQVSFYFCGHELNLMVTHTDTSSLLNGELLIFPKRQEGEQSWAIWRKTEKLVFGNMYRGLTWKNHLNFVGCTWNWWNPWLRLIRYPRGGPIIDAQIRVHPRTLQLEHLTCTGFGICPCSLM